MWKGIINRSFSPFQFGQYVDSIDLSQWQPQFVVLHNTGNPALSDWHKVDGNQRMLNLEHYYRDQQGWSGGPHLFVADDLIWVFTPLNVPGVHSPSWNSITWGVEMVGDYSTEVFGDAVKNNTAHALAILYSKLGRDPGSLRLHREDPKTTHACPGANVDKDEMITLARSFMAVPDPLGGVD